MREITTEELKKLIDDKQQFVLLDCRSSEYFDAEHIPGALNVRWKNVPEEAAFVIPDKNMLTVTYCGGLTCDASIKCFKNLELLGYTNLREYSGGIAEWKARGYTTGKGENI